MKTILTLVAVLFTTVAMSQPPMQRPLPNQFRDYVDFRQAQQRPKVERKDGKVVITMTEQQFRMMQQRRRRMIMHKHVPQRHTCQICDRRGIQKSAIAPRF
jgi:TolA-binding protein